FAADWTARSTSAGVAAAHVVITSSVAGLITSNVLPPSASTYAPSIHRRPGFTAAATSDISGSFRIFVDALAGLASEAARLHVLHNEVVRPVALAERREQELEDRQPRVQPDQVDQLERAHRVVQAELQRLVDVARGRHALLEHAERLVADQRVDARGHESGR